MSGSYKYSRGRMYVTHSTEYTLQNNRILRITTLPRLQNAPDSHSPQSKHSTPLYPTINSSLQPTNIKVPPISSKQHHVYLQLIIRPLTPRRLVLVTRSCRRSGPPIARVRLLSRPVVNWDDGIGRGVATRHMLSLCGVCMEEELTCTVHHSYPHPQTAIRTPPSPLLELLADIHSSSQHHQSYHYSTLQYHHPLTFSAPPRPPCLCLVLPLSPHLTSHLLLVSVSALFLSSFVLPDLQAPPSRPSRYNSSNTASSHPSPSIPHTVTPPPFVTLASIRLPFLAWLTEWPDAKTHHTHTHMHACTSAWAREGMAHIDC